MTVRLYTVEGMGGTFNLWDAGIHNVRDDMLKIPGVFNGGTYTFPQRDQLLAQYRRDRKSQPGEKRVIIGHSLGCVTACSITDYETVNMLALFDCAGGVPSRLGKNTGLALDFADVAASIAPDFRPQAVPGYESRIKRYQGNMGHVQCPFNPQWRAILKSEMERLAK